MTQLNPVHIRVPATTANLGPAFDTCGAALNLWNEVKISDSQSGFSFTVEGEGVDQLPTSKDNLFISSFEKSLTYLNVPVALVDRLRFHCKNEIPLSRGLGSSSAAIVSGLFSAFALCAQNPHLLPTPPHLHPLPISHSPVPSSLVLSPETLSSRFTKDVILSLAAEIEGHPDNVAPAIYGGFQLCIGLDSTPKAKQTADPHDYDDHDHDHPSVHYLSSTLSVASSYNVILFVPNKESKTAETRDLIPRTIPISNAVFNLSRVGLLVHALSSGDNFMLKYAVQDSLHQPFRAKIMPHLSSIITSLSTVDHSICSAVFLSGAGSTVLVLSPSQSDSSIISSSDLTSEFGAEKELRRSAPAENESERVIKRTISESVSGLDTGGYRFIITRATEVGVHLVE